MRATEMKKKLIDIIHSNYRYGGNPYARDQQGELKKKATISALTTKRS